MQTVLEETHDVVFNLLIMFDVCKKVIYCILQVTTYSDNKEGPLVVPQNLVDNGGQLKRHAREATENKENKDKRDVQKRSNKEFKRIVSSDFKFSFKFLLENA